MGSIKTNASRSLLLRMLKRAIYLHALNYGRGRRKSDLRMLVQAVTTFDIVKQRRKPAD